MVLTPTNLYHYLAAKGLAGAPWVTEEDLHVVDLSRRNHAWRVTLRGRCGYVIKQLKEWHGSHIPTLEAEAHWYWLVRNRPEFAPLARFSAQCRAYDAQSHILVVEAPEDCEDLDRYHSRIRAFPAQIAALLGATLAQFHGALSREALEQARGEFEVQIPWVLSWPEMEDPADDALSGGQWELLHIVRENPVFGVSFARLREEWQPVALINGDMKLAHCILSGGGARLYFVDWEMATYGDPLWDAGAILQEYLRAWVRSMPGGSETPAETLVRQARAPIEDLRPAIHGFWHSYGSAGLDRAVGYAAAWLVQNACQMLREQSAITAQAVRLAQLSANMLASPSDAAAGLLGLP